jgi:hypothetical protein
MCERTEILGDIITLQLQVMVFDDSVEGLVIELVRIPATATSSQRAPREAPRELPESSQRAPISKP